MHSRRLQAHNLRVSSETHRFNLSPDEPFLDPQTKARREVLAKIQRMTPDEIVAAGVVATLHVQRAA